MICVGNSFCRQAVIQSVNSNQEQHNAPPPSAATALPRLQAPRSARHHMSESDNPSPAMPQVAAKVTHYENFPVASWLCPPAMRPAIAAIYAFSRTADDLADEGDITANQRLQDLEDFRHDLRLITKNQPPSGRWPQVFGPLQIIIHKHHLPVRLLEDLISAFLQDVEKTRDAERYADRQELLDYCRRSANPVGRLLLHLYGVHDVASQQQSDAICTALQLANFWQDLSVDIPRGRHYITGEDCAAQRVRPNDLLELTNTQATRRLIAQYSQWTRQTMLSGAPLVHRLPGRAGWELRLVVQGGLRILDKIDALHGASLHTRPRLYPWDWVVMVWRAFRM